MEVICVELRKDDPGYTCELYEHLERGDILLLPHTRFMPRADDAEFLRASRQSEHNTHKNIAYKPNQQILTGSKRDTDDADTQRLKRIMAAYSQGALEFLAALLPDYADSWRVDYASFRSLEEQGRDLPIRRRNDLMHVDAFPTRPVHGGRILRLFTNIHSSRDRVWATSDPFEALAGRYASAAGLNRVTGAGARMRRAAVRIGRAAGMRLPDRSAYDEFMLGFHHFLKVETDFQQNGKRQMTAFPPGSSWISFTDQVAHAVLSGQYALEQTVIVPYNAMILPNLAPVSVLERLAGEPLIAHEER